MKRTVRAGLVLTAILGTGCAVVPARFAVRDAAGAKAVKRIAIMPFFLANQLSVDMDAPDKAPGLFSAGRVNYSRMFGATAEKVLGGRFTFVYGAMVEKELMQLGHYTGYVPEAGAGQRTGFTIQDAVQVGKALGVDAILIGAYAFGETQQMRAYFNEAISLRLIDVNTGKVLWGVTSRQSDNGGTVMQKALDKILKEAP